MSGPPEPPLIFACFLYKRSRFYSKIPFSAHAWQLRWFSIDCATGP
jgi:hypothetical protein